MSNIIQNITRCREYSLKQLQFLTRAEPIALALSEKLSSTADINLWGGYFYITVKNREDLQAALSLAPRWEKGSQGLEIHYTATVGEDNYRVIAASEEALPGSCKIVDEEYEIPAQPAQPARIATRKVLHCAKPAAEPAPELQPAEANADAS